MTLRAATYARVSDDEKGKHGYSLPEQKNRLMEHCARLGIQVVEHIEDAGLGGKIINRPGIRRILDLYAAGQINTVVIVHLDRLSRKNWRAQQMREEWQEAGLRVEFVEHSSGQTRDERLHLGMLGVIAENQWEYIREKTMGGRVTKARQGKIPVNCQAFGYLTITKAHAAIHAQYYGRDGELEVIEEEAGWVREMFHRMDNGGSCQGIAAWLNRAGIRTKKGNLWHQTVVRLLLGNPIYVGTFVYGRQQHQLLNTVTEEGKKRTRRSARDPEEWIRIPVPPILVKPDGSPNLELFQRVQERLAHRRQVHRGRPTDIWPLKGVVVCGECALTRGTGQRRCVGARTSNAKRSPGYAYRQYVCGSRANASLEYCGTRYPAKDLEAQALEALRQSVVPGEMGRRARVVAEAQNATADTVDQDRRRLEGELARLDAEERKVAELILRGVAEHISSQMLRPIHAQRAQLQSELQRLKENAVEPTVVQEEVAVAESKAAEIRERWEAISTDPAVFQQVAQEMLSITIWRSRAPDIKVKASPH